VARTINVLKAMGSKVHATPGYVLARRSYERERVGFAAFHSLTLVAIRNKNSN